jgi:hypothetical protein
MLNRTLVPQSAARLIQDMIQSGELMTGEKIPSQRDFSLKLGISRASLREALLTLETLGLVKTEAGRGTFVTDRSGTGGNGMAPWRYSDTYSVFDVFQTRIMLEGNIAALAAGRLTGNQLQAMETATKRDGRLLGQAGPPLQCRSGSGVSRHHRFRLQQRNDACALPGRTRTVDRNAAATDPDNRTGTHAGIYRRTSPDHCSLARQRPDAGAP